MLINTFTGKVKTSRYAAFDTETRILVDGVALSEAQIYSMCGQTHVVNGERVPVYPVSWWREHAEIECWAYIIYTPEGFAIAEAWEEFVELVTSLRIRTGWWYYAPFDFAVIDHHLLSSGFVQAERATSPGTFAELSSDFGARYSMEICFPYTPKKGERSKIDHWKVRFYDLRNIFAGGLARLLESFDVRNGDGIKVRKLTMDYQSAKGNEDDIAYMKADAEGLWWLIQKASAFMEQNYGFSIRNGRPDILTASSLAKKVYLRELYPTARNDSHRGRIFRQEHPITVDIDAYLRRCGLLQGGLVMMNPDFRGKHLKGIEAYRADVNSEYPFIMESIPEIYGHADTFKSAEDARRSYGPSACIVMELSKLSAILRPGMIPAWRHPLTGKLEKYVYYRADADHPPLCIFEEELEELGHWYDIRKTVRKVYAWRTRPNPALSNLIRREYARKAEGKRNKDGVKEYFSKLIMNGLGGKFSQNPNHVRTERVLIEGIVANRARIEDDEPVIDVDPKAMMHVVQGAWITCRGRCYLRKLARQICRGDVAAHLYYTDTDSLHTDVPPPPELVDSFRLGALKIENAEPITEACFLAPKTYYEKSAGDLALHAKGVRTEAIARMLKRGVSLEKIYTPGYAIRSESALTVRGGKAILPLPKKLAKITEANNVNEI